MLPRFATAWPGLPEVTREVIIALVDRPELSEAILRAIRALLETAEGGRR